MEETEIMKYLLKYMKTMCWALVALALTASCDDDDKSVGGFAIDQTEMQFPNDGGTIELKISTDRIWTAETRNDWCMVSPATGVGDGICVIKADSSYLYKERTGRIILYSDKGDVAEVQIKQFGYEQTINLTQAELTVPSYAAPEEAYVDVEAIANVPFEVIIPEDAKEWLTYDNDKNEPYTYTPSTTIPRKQKFRFKFGVYSDFTEDRIAKVQFKQVGQIVTRAEGETALITKTVTITQEKAQLIVPSREGDSLAVLAVTRVMNANLNASTSRPITHWDNLLVEERTYDYYNPVTGYTKKDTTELRVVGFSLSMMDTKETIPYQIKYLTELETFAAYGNSNSYLKRIALGPEIVTLKKLKSISLMGYGVSSLPAEMANMSNLEELDLNGNSILDLNDIKDVLLGLKGNLKSLNLGGNRTAGGIINLSTDIPKNYTLETIGLGGDLSNYDWLFREMTELEELRLSFNYFYGSIPALNDMNKEEVLPKMRMLTLNINRLTGKIPDWIMYHKYLACWDPFTLIFNQEGYDDKGVMAGFSNAPTKFSEFPLESNRTCPDDEEAATIAAKLPELTQAELNGVPLHGNWRYYRMLNKQWYLNYK